MINYFKSLTIFHKSLFIAAALHLIALLCLFVRFENDEAPVLSFSVTMDNNISVSQNNISATAIASSNSSKQKKEKVEETQNHNQNKIVKQKKEEQTEKSKGDNVTNSKQQNAVIGKDSPAVFDASYLNNPAPLYPSLSKKYGEQGIVLLDVYVNISGGVDQIRVNKSSGFARLDNAALTTVKKWRFVPAKKGGQLENSWVQVPINFKLEDAK